MGIPKDVDETHQRKGLHDIKFQKRVLKKYLLRVIMAGVW